MASERRQRAGRVLITIEIDPIATYPRHPINY